MEHTHSLIRQQTWKKGLMEHTLIRQKHVESMGAALLTRSAILDSLAPMERIQSWEGEAVSPLGKLRRHLMTEFFNQYMLIGSSSSRHEARSWLAEPHLIKDFAPDAQLACRTVVVRLRRCLLALSFSCIVCYFKKETEPSDGQTQQECGYQGHRHKRKSPLR